MVAIPEFGDLSAGRIWIVIDDGQAAKIYSSEISNAGILRGFEGDRQGIQPARGITGAPNMVYVRRDRLDPLGKFGEQNLEFKSGNHLTDAAMDTNPEGHVPGGFAGKIEFIRVF